MYGSVLYLQCKVKVDLNFSEGGEFYMLRDMKSFFTHEEGQGMVEYGLIVGLIAIIVIAVFVALGPQITRLFTDVIDENAMEDAQTDLETAIDEELESDT